MVSDKIIAKRIWGWPEMQVVCAIDDDKNRLQLNLARTEIKYNHSIFERINLEIWKWQIAKILMLETPRIRGTKQQNSKHKLRKLLTFHTNFPDGILYKYDCFSVLHPCFVNKLLLKKFYMLKEPINDKNRNIGVQNYISDSSYAILLYNSKEYKDHIKKKYNTIHEKYYHLFELVDFSEVKVNINNEFSQLIEDLFSDVVDMWIPFDFDERKVKFKRAFKLLQKYMDSNWL